jgi:hypothetical protein
MANTTGRRSAWNVNRSIPIGQKTRQEVKTRKPINWDRVYLQGCLVACVVLASALAVETVIYISRL